MIVLASSNLVLVMEILVPVAVAESLKRNPTPQVPTCGMRAAGSCLPDGELVAQGATS
jgi:hypothetical protein